MKIFIDTANIADVAKLSRFGIIDGVTTNPALIARPGLNFRAVVEEMYRIVDRPVSAEDVPASVDTMIEVAEQTASFIKMWSLSLLHPKRF